MAVMKAEESYENLAKSFQNVFAEINNMVDDPTLTIDQENYKVIFYFCSDYKVQQYAVLCVYSFNFDVLFIADVLGSSGSECSTFQICLCVV